MPPKTFEVPGPSSKSVTVASVQRRKVEFQSLVITLQALKFQGISEKAIYLLISTSVKNCDKYVYVLSHLPPEKDILFYTYTLEKEIGGSWLHLKWSCSPRGIARSVWLADCPDGPQRSRLSTAQSLVLDVERRGRTCRRYCWSRNPVRVSENRRSNLVIKLPRGSFTWRDAKLLIYWED